MLVIYRQVGEAVEYTPSSEVKAGDVVVQGELVAVAKRDIPASQVGSLYVEGVFEFPKATGTGSAITVGSKVYWDAAEKVAKIDAEAGANKLIGKTVKAAVDADATVLVRLTQ